MTETPYYIIVLSLDWISSLRIHYLLYIVCLVIRESAAPWCGSFDSRRVDLGCPLFALGQDCRLKAVYCAYHLKSYFNSDIWIIGEIEWCLLPLAASYCLLTLACVQVGDLKRRLTWSTRNLCMKLWKVKILSFTHFFLVLVFIVDICHNQWFNSWFGCAEQKKAMKSELQIRRNAIKGISIYRGCFVLPCPLLFDVLH